MYESAKEHILPLVFRLTEPKLALDAVESPSLHLPTPTLGA